MRKGLVGSGIAVMLLSASVMGHTKDGPRGSFWPVQTYVASDSVLGTYYRQFINQYGAYYTNSTMAFQSFCRRLRSSDLLADQFNRIGIPARQIFSILRDLESSKFTAKGDQYQIRQNMLAIDLALETLEGAITHKSRAEFRREVLAEIPPLTSTG